MGKSQRHQATLLFVAGLLFACAEERSGFFESGPLPAPKPLTAGDFKLSASELPNDNEPIRFIISPTAGAETTRRQYSSVTTFLSRQLGAEVQLAVSDSYESFVERVVADDYDLALIPPLSYVKAKARNPGIHLLATALIKCRSEYSAFILVRSDDPAADLYDLKGRRIAMVSKSSTSGYLLPFASVRSMGVTLEEHFSEVVFAGTHTRAIELLAQGKVDAAATATGMVAIAKEFNTASEALRSASFRVVHKSGEAPYDAFCASDSTPRGFRDKVSGVLALMNSRNTDAHATLDANTSLTGWFPTVDAAYDPIRRLFFELETEQEEKAP